MKKQIFIIGILLVMMLVIGCAQDQSTTMKSQTTKKTTPESNPEPEKTPEQQPESEEEERILIDPANLDEEEPEPATVSISQADLDRLKADLEGMDVEDLGGLTEE